MELVGTFHWLIDFKTSKGGLSSGVESSRVDMVDVMGRTRWGLRLLTQQQKKNITYHINQLPFCLPPAPFSLASATAVEFAEFKLILCC